MWGPARPIRPPTSLPNSTTRYKDSSKLVAADTLNK